MTLSMSSLNKILWQLLLERQTIQSSFTVQLFHKVHLLSKRKSKLKFPSQR